MSPMTPARLAVLVSGSGSNLQAVLDACAARILPASVVVVVSNRLDAYALSRARKASVPTLVREKTKNQSRVDYDAGLATALQPFAPDWIILAGWMRLLTPAFLDAFPGRVINLHPALPGQFPGTHAIERAFAAFQRGEIQETGVMVHFVPNAEVDAGPVIRSAVVPITAADTLDSLEQRIHETEHKIIIDAISHVIQYVFPEPKV